MIVPTMPDRCPRCGAMLHEDRGEMAALRLGSAGMDQPLAYAVAACTNGHTVQVGAPPAPRPQPAWEHRHTCAECGLPFLGRIERRYCSKACATKHARVVQQKKAPAARPQRPLRHRGPGVAITPSGPELPYARKSGSWRWA